MYSGALNFIRQGGIFSRRRPVLPVRGTIQRNSGYRLTVTATKMPIGDSIKGILFDIDGTLTDSDPLHFKCVMQPLIVSFLAPKTLL